jgi:hypothetical protein
LLRLVIQGEPIENCRSSIFPHPLAKFFISKKRYDCIGQLLFIFRSYQHAGLAMLDHFLNALPAAANGGLAASHRLQVNASQAFITTGQRENGAPLHGPRDIITVLQATKVNLVCDAKFRHKLAKSSSLWPIADDLKE